MEIYVRLIGKRIRILLFSPKANIRRAIFFCLQGEEPVLFYAGNLKSKED